MAIRLLGKPHATRDGNPAVLPRGRKTWAVLAYLVRAEVRPTREALAQLFFPDADDPLGALRWTLSDLRRLVGSPGAAKGDPVDLALGEDTTVDIDVLIHGSWQEAVALPGLGCRLLEGVNVGVGASFQLWLENQQRHLAAETENRLHEAALARLTEGDVTTGLDLASRLVELNPLDENAQVLYVRCLALGGHAERAERQVEACVELFRRELEVEPTPALREAAAARPPATRQIGRAGVVAQLEAGEAAFAAGAIGPGLGIMQQAVVDAESVRALDLLAKALVALGSALVHAARGSDEEGAAVLHRAIKVAAQIGDSALAATAHRELGYVQFLRGSYVRAETWLSRAATLTGEQGGELPWILAVRGAAQTDTGNYAGARESLIEAAERAQASGATRAHAWARSFLGRLHLLRDERIEARAELTIAIEVARNEAWNAFLPWPEALLAEVDLNDGAVEQAAEAFEHAFAMGCQLGDPCWESMAARGIGRVATISGDHRRARELLEDAPRRCRRLPDSYRWIEAYGLAAAADAALATGVDRAKHLISELEILASRLGMRELMATAAILRARAGESGAAGTAAVIAAEVDNPVLHRQLAAAR